MDGGKLPVPVPVLVAVPAGGEAGALLMVGVGSNLGGGGRGGANPTDPGANGNVTKIPSREHLGKHYKNVTDEQLKAFHDNFIKGKKGQYREDAGGRPGYVYEGNIRGEQLEAILTPDGAWVSLRPVGR
jgi:hypothetical protein